MDAATHAAEHPIMHTTASPSMKNYPAPNVNCAEAERLQHTGICEKLVGALLDMVLGHGGY